MKGYLTQLHLKNFRCFKTIDLDLDSPLVVIHGINGSGKTSLLEALHYVGYLRSFRTRTPRDLIRFGADTFFIKAASSENEVSIGCSSAKRQVKINQKAVTSFQELWNFHRVVTVTEDDLEIVKGSPEKRRSFVDSAIILQNPKHAEHLKTYRTILDHRNALLQKHSINDDELLVWTEKLWEATQIIQERRKEFLEILATKTVSLTEAHCKRVYSITLTYKEKTASTPEWKSFKDQWKHDLFPQELRYRRSLFGAHLDDIAIFFQEKPARIYSSRGQQKLIVMLLKIALVNAISKDIASLSFLIDDFLTDFDEKTMNEIIEASLDLNVQLIFTSPIAESKDTLALRSHGAKEINLSI